MIRPLAVLTLMVLSFAAQAADCPPDKPHKRTVASGILKCTAQMCIGELRCPRQITTMLPPGTQQSLIGADCYYSPSGACNTCIQEVTEICLSQDDLDRASR